MSGALERSASVLASSGTSFEEYLGLVTAATEITRDADKVANGLKTISLRLQGMTDEGEEDLELMSKLGSELSKIGVATQDADGNLRSTYDILKDLSVAYKDLSESEKSYYTQLVSGVYQSNVLNALMENFQSAIDATSTALDSNGSALRENEAYLESIAGKVSILQSEFQKLSYTTIESDFIKGIVDLGTGVLRLINNMGGLVPVLSTILGLVALYKAEKLTNFINELLSSIKQVGPALLTVQKNFTAFIASVKSGNGVLSSFGTLVGGIGGGIGVALTAFGLITAAIGAYNQKQKELMQNAAETIQTFSDYTNSIEDVKQQYLNILDSTDSYSEKQKQLAELQETLIKQYGMEEEAVRNLNLERENGIEILSEEIKKNAEKTLAETGSQYQKAKKEIEKGVYGVSATQTIAYAPVLDLKYETDIDGKIRATSEEVEALTSRFEFLKATIEDTGGQPMVDFTIQTEDMYDKSEKLEEILAYLNERYNSFAGNTELEAGLLQYLSSELEKVNSVLEENGTVFEGYNEAFATMIKNSEEFSTSSIETEEQFENWSDAILEAAGSNEQAREILQEYTEEVGRSLGYIEDYSDSAQNVAKTQEEVQESFSDAYAQLESVENAYNTLTGAVEEYNETGAISYDTLNSLLTLGDEYLSMLDIENGKLVINSEKLREKEQELKNNALAANAAALGAEIHAIANRKEGEEAEIAADKTASLSDKFRQLATDSANGAMGVAALTGGIAALNSVMSQDPNWQGFTDEQEAEINDAIDRYSKIQDTIKKFSLTASYTSKGGSSGSSGTSASKATDPLEEQSKIFKEQVEIMEHELFIMEKLGASEEERIKKNKQLQSLIHSQADWFRKHGASEDSEYIRDLQQQFWSYQDEIEGIEDEITQKHLDAFNERLQISENYIEDKNYYDNWGADNEIAAWQRVLKWMKEEYFDKGLISWEEYSESVREINKNLHDAMKADFEDRMQISEDYISDRNFYGDWGADSEIAAWQRVLKWMKEEYFDKGLISWQEYSDSVEEINKKLFSAMDQAFEDRLQISKDYVSDKNFYDNWGADSEVEAWKRVLEWMKTEYFDKGLVSWQTYSDAVKEINKNLYSALEKEWEDALNSQIDSAEKNKEAYEALFDYMVAQIDKEIEALEKQKDAEEEYWDAKIEALKKQNEEIEEQIKLEEAQEELERAKSQKTMRVYYEGKGWVWEADRSAVEDAEEKLEELEREQELNDELERLEELKEEAIKNIEDQIEAWEKYKEEWSSVVSDYQTEQDKLLIQQQLGIDLENENWKNRLDNLQTFVDGYREKMEEIARLQEELNNGYQLPETPSYEEPEPEEPEEQTPPKQEEEKVDWSQVWRDAQNAYERGEITEEEKNRIQEEAHRKKAEEMAGSGLVFNPGSGLWEKPKSYSSGGIVDYTGNAMVHGSKSRPEVVLNNSQAANLYSWVKSLQPRTEMIKRESSSGYNFSGAVFNITTNANNFDSLVRDIKLKVQNR